MNTKDSFIPAQGDALPRRAFLKTGTIGALSLAFSLFLETRGAEAALKVGEPPPRSTLPDLKGNKVNLPQDFLGKVVLIHFWASWCPYCVKEMVAIESLYNTYKEKGLMPFSVNVGENPAAAEAYMASIKVTYPILMDSSSATAKQYGISGIPTTFILDRKGIIRFKILGEVNSSGLKKIISTLV